MIVSTLIELLECVRDLAKHARDDEIAAELEDRKSSLVPFADRVINVASRKAIRASFGNEDLKMRFGRALAFLKVFHRGAEKVGRATDVKALQGMISELESAPKRPRVPPADVDAQPANDPIDLREAIEALGAAGPDRKLFEPVFSRLRSATLRELNRASLAYAGSDGHRTKDAALAAIRSKFESKVQRQRKSEDIKRLSSRRKKG